MKKFNNFKERIQMTISNPQPKLLCPLIKEECREEQCELWNKNRNKCTMVKTRT